MQHITTLALTLAHPEPTNATMSHVSAMAPYLQGFLMEKINSAYAEKLHRLSFNPYSQYFLKDRDEEGFVWRVCSLTDEATEQIIAPLGSIECVALRSLGVTFNVMKRTTETIPLKSLTDVIFEKDETSPYVRFLTPAAFKSRGEYVFMPTPRLMLQNLLMRYGQVYEGNGEVDEDTISYIEQHVRISSYNLRSQYFGNVMKGGRKLPAFVGSMTLSVSGPSTMVGLVRMMLKFGEYSGVGIKTAMGMGGIVCQRPEWAQTSMHVPSTKGGTFG